MPSKTIVIDYQPQAIFEAYHARTQRFALGVAHRRAGKTVAYVNDMIRRAVTTSKSRYRASYKPVFVEGTDDCGR
jgi:phage terminase large subunit